MNRKIFSAIVLVCAIMLSGCGLTESGELMSGARKFIENGEYDKAMTNLSKVLNEDEANTEARGMYYQAMKLKKAKRYHDRKAYQQEIKELQDLLNDNSGSAKVRSQAEEMLTKAQEYLKNQNRASITRKENAKKAAEENKNKYRAGEMNYSRRYFKNKYDYGYGQNEDKEEKKDLGTGQKDTDSGNTTNNAGNAGHGNNTINSNNNSLNNSNTNTNNNSNVPYPKEATSQNQGQVTNN